MTTRATVVAQPQWGWASCRPELGRPRKGSVDVPSK